MGKNSKKIQENLRTSPGDPNNRSFRKKEQKKEREGKLLRNNSRNFPKLMGIYFEIKRAHPVTSTIKEDRLMLIYIIVKFQKPEHKGDFTIFREEKKRNSFQELERHWLDFSILGSQNALVKCPQNAEGKWETQCQPRILYTAKS